MMPDDLIPTSSSTAERTRRKIFTGAIECVERWGLQKTTLNDIATAAGVSRQTVYNYFGNKEEVLAAAFDDLGEKFRSRVLAIAESIEDPQGSLVETMVYTITHLPQEPYLKLLADTEFFPAFLRDFYGTDLSRERIGEITRVCLHNTPELLKQADEIGEITSRFLISMLVSDGGVERSEAQLRDFIHRRVMPGLMQA